MYKYTDRIPILRWLLSGSLHFRAAQLLLLGILLAFGGYTFGLMDNLFPGGDNARYLILAKALVTGNGYRNIATPAAPYHTLAPPGFPLLLATIRAAFGSSIVIAKMCVALLATLSIVVVYVLFRQEYSERYALGLAALYSITPVVFMYARRVYSDLPFVLISTVAVMSVKHYTAKKSRINADLAIAILLLAIAFYLRPAALALIAASGLWLLVKKQPVKAALLCLPTALLIIPWYSWVAGVSTTTAPGHLSAFLSQSDFLELARMALSNGLRYARLFTENTWYLTTKALEHLALSTKFAFLSMGSIVLANGLILTGFAHCARRRGGLAELYVVIYTMMLLSYGFVLDRFIIPLMPFILHYFIQGLTVFTAWIERRNRAIAIGLKQLCILMVILSGSTHIAARIYQEHNFASFSPSAAGHYDVARWAGDHLASTAVVVTDYPDFFYVYANRQTVAYPQDITHLAFDQTLRFVVADSAQIATLQQWAQQQESNYIFTPRYCTTGSKICLYEVLWATKKNNA